VFGMHEVVLPLGVTPDEYAELFGKESASSASCQAGRPISRRAIEGKARNLLLLFEVESVEARDRYFPRPEETPEELRQFYEQHPDGPEWEKLTGFLSQPHSWTNHVVVGASSSSTSNSSI
jgi:hypothetical protein